MGRPCRKVCGHTRGQGKMVKPSPTEEELQRRESARKRRHKRNERKRLLSGKGGANVSNLPNLKRSAQQARA
jgi:hypothetical protein